MQHDFFKISGRSGCVLTIKTVEDMTLVNKKSPSPDYNSRLLSQARKQDDFLLKPILPGVFTAPRIIGSPGISDTGLAWFEMTYISGRSYSEFLEESPVDKLNEFINSLILFLEHLIEQSPCREIPSDIIIDKTRGILSHISLNKKIHGYFKQDIEQLILRLEERPILRLPIGQCHGDLTLSNMIFGNGMIYLIDFLDSFIDSPIIDIVKIRQDTKYHWSLMLENERESFEIQKIIQALNHIDSKIHSHFLKYSFYSGLYTYFEKLNLLRIVPYAKSYSELKFIKSCLNLAA
jgi:hypothetical protein